MPDSPISATPYDVLGVPPTATDDELRKAYRRMLRQSHPDTGGDAALFVAVQQAWERVGTPTDRAIYDRGGSGSSSAPHASWATPGSRPRQDTRPRAKAYGHPGGWRRQRFLGMMREWVGRGTDIDDPYDPTLVRRAPQEIRHTLADALAEEATATMLADLGIGWTVWHDVATGAPEEKIDHVVLGPTGLYAILSEDFGEPVRVKRGELIGAAVGDHRPMHELGARAKTLTRSMRVRFTALVIVLPDDHLGEPIVDLGPLRGAATVAVRRSVLPGFLRNGLQGLDLVDGTQLFDVRTKLQAGIHFV
ncbi:J domain-containing protein [Marisediminicola senii]|uniref:J domain-containing protein n=1 Tax=Marisediminicola senii TaxID=2711233 RepID=UPI0013EC10E4|nr:DnaJ domain-containing protein [Marisediminicola senii]